MRNDPSGAEVIHNLRTAVLDRDGRLTHDFRRKRLERCRPPEGVAACRRERLRRPDRSAFTPAERRAIDRCRTPLAVQRFLNALPYNHEPPAQGETLRSFRGVIRHGAAHCLEAALAAAVIMEQHGRPPLVLSFESIDGLDHVIYVYQSRGLLGIGRAVAEIPVCTDDEPSSVRRARSP